LNGYWPERIRLLEGGYKSIPFPFDEMTPPSLWIEAQWNLDQLAGFLDSWSATQRYKQQHGNHPLEQVWEKITAAWGAESKTRTVRWPLHFRVGRNKPE
jgi:hypothetical protein